MSESNWQTICSSDSVQNMLGVRALVNQEQVAIFRVKDKLHAISAIDPFTKAAVLSRGIIGDLQGKVVVASPLYKQHFVLETGECMEDETASVKTYPVREQNGEVQIQAV